jgi:hypothetical protein
VCQIATFFSPEVRPLKEMPQFYNWVRYTKHRILQAGYLWGRYINCRIFTEFYKLGTPGAVTQTIEFLPNFTNWAPLGPLHKLEFLTNFTNWAPLGPLHKLPNF